MSLRERQEVQGSVYLGRGRNVTEVYGSCPSTCESERVDWSRCVRPGETWGWEGYWCGG